MRTPVIAVVMSLACSPLGRDDVPIASLLSQPAGNDGRTVVVRGRVGGVLKLPFVRARFYTVADSTGQIIVMSYENRLPDSGAVVRVRGRFSNAAIVGGSGYGAHMVVGEPAPAQAGQPR